MPEETLEQLMDDKAIKAGLEAKMRSAVSITDDPETLFWLGAGAGLAYMLRCIHAMEAERASR